MTVVEEISGVDSMAIVVMPLLSCLDFCGGAGGAAPDFDCKLE